jgi:hypothetical protein
VLTDQLECARVQAGLQSPCDAALNDGARVSADVGKCSIVPLGLERRCARS